jgi:hypothetical protein
MKQVWDAQDRVGQTFAPAIKSALADSWDVSKIIQAWGQASPSHLWTRKQTVDWVKLHIIFNNDKLSEVLTKVWATGYEFGRASAEYYLKQGRLSKADNSNDPTVPQVNVPSNFDWANWVPGNIAAAVIANPVGGFAKRLAERGVTLKGINDTTANRIGTVLADGLRDGLSPSDVSSSIAGEIISGRTDWAQLLTEKLIPTKEDEKRAMVIARTEMNQAVIDEQASRYRDAGVSSWTWQTLETGEFPCEDCAPNDGETRTIGDEFPSGDTEPLVHPNCNCTVIPDTSEFTAGLYDDSEKALQPKYENKVPPTIGVPGSLEMNRALSRLDILPNPTDPQIRKPIKFVETPWQVVPIPTIDPNIWDNATIQVVTIGDLFGTDPYLKRSRVRHHIESMGQALTPYRSYAMVLEKDGKQLIVDGHHRLMSLWLLGLDKAPVWLVKEKK